MKIFIINLKNKKDNYKRTINQLKKTNLEANNIYRYNALDGKKVNIWNENINLFCKLFCTKKIIGCGLSHIMLYKKLQKFDDEYFLILEDDIKIMPEIDYKKKIDNIINKINNIDKNWDVINLNNQGFFCKTYKKIQCLCGSSASYLISKNALKMMLDVIQTEFKWLTVNYLYLGFVNTKFINVFDPRFLEIVSRKKKIIKPQEAAKLIIKEIKYVN